uniref:Uncharacterized protein n=1 Tax=Rhizophagus irregularis (strain DAOM 181602 / DAOM 197198 / MUCL 43194) TaxID=747089 RepID=U9TSA8_RHIID
MRRKIASSYVLQAQEKDSETIQTSRHSSDLNVQANDQEVDVAEIDNIIAKKISCLLLESEFTLEEIWKKRSLDDSEQWKAKFSSDLKSVDADLTFKTVEFLFYLATNVYEEKFDIGTFELIW